MVVLKAEDRPVPRSTFGDGPLQERYIVLHLNNRDGVTRSLVSTVANLRRALQSTHRVGFFHLQFEHGAAPLPVMVQSYRRDPSGQIREVDLLVVRESDHLRICVPVETVGRPACVASDGAYVSKVSAYVVVRALPRDLPDAVCVDVSRLSYGDEIRASELALPPEVELVSPPDEILCRVERRPGVPR